MSKTRRCLANFSFYDQRGIEKKLGQMAAQGWMIAQPGGLLWTYRKIRPQRLRFAVTYFPSASEFDPHPSQRQLMKEDFCAQDGWKLAARWEAMQIFYTDRADAVPIDTDPVTQVETIHRTMSKRILTAQLLSLASTCSFWYTSSVSCGGTRWITCPLRPICSPFPCGCCWWYSHSMS